MAIEIDIKNLDVREKLDLMECIWADLCQDEDAISVPDWHRDVLAERIRQVEAGETDYIDWDDAKKIIDSRRR